MEGRRSSSVWRWLFGFLVVGMLITAIATAISLAAVFNEIPSDLLVTIDGQAVDLHGITAGHAWLVFGLIITAVVVVVVVVPLALLFGVGIPLLLAGLGVLLALVCAGAAVAVVGSPLILLALLLWWAVRPKKRAPSMPPAPSAPPPVPVIGQHTDNSTPFA